MYRPWLDAGVLRQMDGFPDGALDTLTRLLGRICEDPYDRLFSRPLEDDLRARLAELGDDGFIEFRVDEDAGLIHVYRLVWTG
jgi:hypothetical protein